MISCIKREDYDFIHVIDMVIFANDVNRDLHNGKNIYFLQNQMMMNLLQIQEVEKLVQKVAS